MYFTMMKRSPRVYEILQNQKVVDKTLEMVGNENNQVDAVASQEHLDQRDGNVKGDMNKINSLKLEEENNNLGRIVITREEFAVDRVKFEGLNDKDSIFSNESSQELPAIPDGGWGWVVVLACFLVSACADGLAYSFGILHEEFTNYFQESQTKTSLIGSLFISIPLISGPVMSVLVDKYGCRVMTIIAGICATGGFLLASLSNSIEMLCVTLGVISGLSMGILYVTSVVSVAFWFDKRRTLAVSLASCGIGFGTLVYSPVTNFFIELYDWRNALILLAGTVFNMCVCGALMRDPDWVIVKENREKKLAKTKSKKLSSAGSLSSRSVGGESVYLTAEELNDLLKSGKNPEYILETLTTSLAAAEQLEATTQINAQQSHKRVNSVVHLPTYIQQNIEVPAEVVEKLMTNKTLYKILFQNYPQINRRKSDVNINQEELAVDLKEPFTMKVTVLAKKTKELKNKVADDNNEKIKIENNEKKCNTCKCENPSVVKNLNNTKIPTVNGDTHLTGTNATTDHHHMSLYGNTIMHQGALMTVTKYKLRASSLPDIYKTSTWSLCSDEDKQKKWYNRIVDSFKSVIDIRMFTELHFFMFNLGSLILFTWSIIPYFYLKSYMTERGVDGGALQISIIGIASGIGIVALGWAGDKPWLNVSKAYAVCLMVCGLTVAAYPLFITDFWALAVVSTVFGLSYASSYSYTPAILMELVPMESFTIGYGFILLSQGLGHLIGPPLGGLIFDLTQSWDLTFYVGGAWLVVSGACIGVIPFTRNVRLCGSAPLLKDGDQTPSKGSSA